MTAPVDGGAAFPQHPQTSVDYSDARLFGMSLRDWFATHAPEPSEMRMANERAVDRSRNPHNDSYKPQPRSDELIRAQLAYRHADAMLAARVVQP